MRDELLTRGEFFRKLAEDIATENFLGVSFLLGRLLVPWQLSRVRQITIEQQPWSADQLETYYHELQAKQAMLAIEHARDSELKLLSTLSVLESAFNERQIVQLVPELRRNQKLFCQVAASLEKTYGDNKPGDKKDFHEFLTNGNSWNRGPFSYMTTETINAINVMLDRETSSNHKVRDFIAVHVTELLKTAEECFGCSKNP